MTRPLRHAFLVVTLACLPLLAEGSARGDIPAGYTGKPFDPAVAGGVGIIPPTVKAGPYAIPGRIDFVNYDMGGSGITFHAGDMIYTKSGAGYRTDKPSPTFVKTDQTSPSLWYDTGVPSLDGTFYPSPTTTDFYIGAVQVGDWYDFTVNVMTTGTYYLSSTWASGNGPPGGEGGNGAMGLDVYVNGTKEASWSTIFPNYLTKASFDNWVPYPNFASVTLTAGMQLLKLLCTTKHLNLDYVEFTLGPKVGGPPGPEPGDGGAAAASGSSAGSGASSGSNAASGTASGSAAASGAASGTSAGAAGASSGTVVMGTTGATGAGGTGASSGTLGVGGTSGAGGGSAGTAGTGSVGASSGSVGVSSGSVGPSTGSVGASSGTATPTSQSNNPGCAIRATPLRPGASGIAALLVACGVLLARRRR